MVSVKLDLLSRSGWHYSVIVLGRIDILAGLDDGMLRKRRKDHVRPSVRPSTLVTRVNFVDSCLIELSATLIAIFWPLWSVIFCRVLSRLFARLALVHCWQKAQQMMQENQINYTHTDGPLNPIKAPE